MYEIETVVKPILEEMEFYKGKEVSSREIFEKYILASPDGIKSLWKFEIIVQYELNLFIKSTIYEGDDPIHVWSCNPKDAARFDHKNWDGRTSWLSSMPGRFFYIDDDEGLVETWLRAYESFYEECEYPNNKLYRYERQHETVARYWLRHGRHDPSAKNHVILRAQKTWDRFIKEYICWKSKIKWIGILPFKNKSNYRNPGRRWL